MRIDRFSVALASAAAPKLDLLVVTGSLYSAVMEACTYEKDPYKDPAVLLLSMQVGFLTNADIGTRETYNQLIEACQAKAGGPMLAPSELH